MAATTHYLCCFCLLAGALQASAQPSLSSSSIIADQKVYRDAKQLSLYYYIPFDYQLVKDSKGKPEFSLTQMRYTGTKATGDEGVAKFNNLLQFRISVDGTQQKKITDLRAELKKTDPAVELRSLPVRKFSSVLVFAGSGDTAGADSVRLVKTNFAEAIDDQASVNNSYWNERIITLRLSNFDAQLVESALRKQQSVMSFSYAIYTVFSEADQADVTVTGNREVGKAVKDFFATEIMNQKDSALRITLVKADAVDLKMNPDQWPDLIRKVDINEKVPAKYPLFDVYCYDFNNELRPDLYIKKIEIKATSVNGSDVVTDYSFKASRPDVYAKSIRFAYAVRFDKPFFFRVTEVNNDGESVATAWKQKKEWSELLDITSTPDKVIAKPTIPDQ